ncbi:MULTISPECIES: phosphotransferase [unclassified Parabacteroides]|uniref:phosphotransferase n=1 Tax=unclassified Parabacteroides TaxID=2649774 RepID=UPI002473F455|nr:MULTISPECIES: phosphotransferase [unclassified Parabacteroides]
MGTPGEEQKVSILGYRPDAKESFFAKYAEKKEARRLAHNEIKILKKLEGKGIAPQLMSAVEEDDFVFFITSRVNGTLYKSNSISNRVIELAASISKIDISDRTQNKSLKESFSHGDFCPWNIMVENGELRLIDWEMAAIRPLGYDLFLFIIHANFVMGATCEYVTKVLRENQQAITFYFQQFDIKDYRPYLKHFVLDRIFVESGKRHIQMVEKYEQIAETFSLKTKI